METIKATIQRLLDWAAPYWEEARGAPRLIWKWTEGQTIFRGVAIGLAVFAALLVLGLIISFFRANWKGKIRNLLVAAVGFVAVCALLIVAKREVEGFLQPEEETVTLGGEEVVLYPQYSLARARDTYNIQWTLTDPVITLPVDEDLIVQLAGLDSLDEKGGCLAEQIQRTRDGLGLSLWQQFETWQSDTVERLSYLNMEIWALPDRELQTLPWYRDPGQVGTGTELGQDEGPVSYTVLENSGDRVVFVQQNEWTPGGKLAEARQAGPDVVLVLSSGFYFDYDNKDRYAAEPVESPINYYDPLADEEAVAVLREPLEALFAEHIRCLRGLTAEERERVLPDRIVNYPVENAEQKNGGFSLPCESIEELLLMDMETQGAILRFVGESPEGERVLYTVTPGAMKATNQKGWGEDNSWFADWDKAFQAGCGHPDETMSNFLGAPAVAYEGGWLLNPGSYTGFVGSSPVDAQEYYYLTMEPQP